MSKVALAAGITHALVAVGHTLKGLSTFDKSPYRTLPPLLHFYAKIGWFQGGAFFGILGLYTYQLSQRAPETWTGLDRMILGCYAAVYLVSSASYFRAGDKATGGVTALGGGMVLACLAQ